MGRGWGQFRPSFPPQVGPDQTVIPTKTGPRPTPARLDVRAVGREHPGETLGRPVELVVASAIKNPYFRESVERTQALLYAA